MGSLVGSYRLSFVLFPGANIDVYQDRQIVMRRADFWQCGFSRPKIGEAGWS